MATVQAMLNFVSVLLPVYNAAATLPAALRSVQQQIGVKWECICIDDGSTDATPEILAKYACQDSRFRVLSQPHLGLVAALCRGLRACRAPLVARMDADDLMHPQRLWQQLQALTANPTLAGVGCRVLLFPRPKIHAGYQRYARWLDQLVTPEDIFRERFIECPLLHPTWMFRKEVLESFPYDDVPWPEDYDLLLRLLHKGHRLACIPRRLHAWRIHVRKVSRNDPRYTPKAFALCKAYYLAAGPLRTESRYILWGYGASGRRLCRALELFNRLPLAIVDVHPRRIGQNINGAPVIRPDALTQWPRLPVLVSVARNQVRHIIRSFLVSLGRREGVDWFFVA